MNNPEHSAQLKSVSIALGIFMGIIPLWGFQLVTAIFLALILKLNKALVIIAANISLPPMIPVIIFASYKTGAIWMGENALQINFSRNLSVASIRQNLQQYIYGSITLAIVTACFCGSIAFILMKLFNSNKFILAGK